ncbi:MAG: hypothetical protein E6J26_11625 [Chloroflexi bacterium]|nr:MAG: hypothetical protein E6J26_11625 [Chloroflexota bacterium]
MPQNTRLLTAVEHNTSSGGDTIGPTIAGHSASLYDLSVAAAPYFSLTTPETFSSRGPARHYFGPVVNTIPAPAIATQFIQQPDFTATDGGCTTFFGGFSGGCYRFFGTSAAAPHAAAVGALIKEMANRQGKPLNQGLMRFVLQTKARAMAGGNLNSVGAGLIDALGSANLTEALKNVFIPLIRR